ncbi:MAG: 50S ribosomal protein L11 methyltransferase [Deltaproteobacteria bacterium]|nr:50S ribosomal protein L11 methyltransferase [Deltaproteobacteria bacterium]MBW2127918.1 50S ribosomal protein L11 methyltransferase [Deltaproteobacteria bacterium]MBW2304477.1 50S ribosomal protein L11 methyltransferase [Deltaproteobacteria bacterium]
MDKGRLMSPYGDLYIYLVEGRVDESLGDQFGDKYLGNWVEDGWSFLFFTVPCRERIAADLREKQGLEIIDEFHFPYSEWQGGDVWPQRVAGFRIVPPWEKEDRSLRDEMEIILDPGVVFGNGLHPTTRDCIRALVYLRRVERFNRVIDLGTGTGILSLAAAKLGAGRVLAVDLNPLCVKTAMKNVSLNGLRSVVQVQRGKAEELVDTDADLVLANIHYEVLEGLVRKAFFQDTRWFIFSGLMRTQARRLERKLAESDLKVQKRWDHEMIWYTFLIRRI